MHPNAHTESWCGRRLLHGLVAVLAGLAALPASAFMIEYEATQLVDNAWRYDYTVTNDSLADGFDGFTIYFDEFAVIEERARTTRPNEDWSVLTAVTDPLLGPGFFDAANFGDPVAFAERVTGFSIEFSWLGAGVPGSQMFDVYRLADDGFSIAETLFSGDTTSPGAISVVPLPPAGLLFVSALLGLFAFPGRTRLKRSTGALALGTGLLLLGLAAPDRAIAASSLEGVTVELVPTSGQRINRIEFRYTFDVIITSPVDAPNARGSARTDDFRFSIEEAAIGPADLVAGEPRVFEDAATLVVARSWRFDPSALDWSFVSDRPPAPLVRVDPASLDFGAPNPGCGTNVRIQVHNDGDAPLQVSGLEIVPDPAGNIRFPTGFGSSNPFRIDPGRQFAIPVGYETLDTAPHEARIRFATNDPLAPTVEIVISGSGSPVEPVSETFAQLAPREGPVDLLFTTDRSGSMNNTLTIMEPLFQGIVDELFASTLDFRMAIVAEASACPIGPTPWIDRNLGPAAARDAVRAQLALNAGLDHPDTERLFTFAERALSEANIGEGGCLEGFLRDDAGLAIVSVSDEPEQSLFAFSEYLERFRALKAEPSDFVHHTIGGPLPSGCRVNTFSPIIGGPTIVFATAGTGYADMTSATGGLFVPICETDWTPVVDTVASAFADGRTNVFPLSEPAVAQTLRVFVDGIERTDALGGGRSEFADDPYPVSSQGVEALAFESAAIPATGSEITATYTPLRCD